MKVFLLILLACVDQQCEVKSIYVVDRFEAVERADALADCNGQLEARGDSRLVCLTPDEVDDMIDGAPAAGGRHAALSF